jgi:TatD DNase family protein
MRCSTPSFNFTERVSDLAVLIDTHLHLYRQEFGEEQKIVRARAEAAGVCAFLHVGYNAETIDLAQELADGDPWSFASAGLHPHDAADWDDRLEGKIRALADAGKIVAIGECGLDYYRDLSPRDAQDHAFRAQIRLARECDLPMIHHVRDAWPEARAVLEEEGLPPRRGVFHAFAGDADFARWAVGEGYRLGIGGVLTYRNAHLPEAIDGLPAEALFLETDAPWLPPQPWRGRRNEPAYLRHTAAVLAEKLGLSLDELSGVWAAEFERVFRVELPAGAREVRPESCPVPVPAGKC